MLFFPHKLFSFNFLNIGNCSIFISVTDFKFYCTKIRECGPCNFYSSKFVQTYCFSYLPNFEVRILDRADMSNSYVPFVMTGCASLEGPGYFAYTSGALLKMSGCLVSAGTAD